MIKFDNPASDITLALGQFYADEKKRGELAVFTAFDADGNVVAAGVLDPAKATAKVSEAVFQFDLGLNGVSRIELTAADLYNGGKQGKPQSDFNLQSLSYAPTVATTDLPSPQSRARTARTWSMPSMPPKASQARARAPT